MGDVNRHLYPEAVDGPDSPPDAFAIAAKFSSIAAHVVRY